MTDQTALEKLARLAKEATNGWACYARTKREHDEIARLHREIDAAALAREGTAAEGPAFCACGHLLSDHGKTGTCLARGRGEGITYDPCGCASPSPAEGPDPDDSDAERERLEMVEQIERLTAENSRLRGGLRPAQGEAESWQSCIVRLRLALSYYADPDTGWAEVEHADAYEASKELVPLKPDEVEADALTPPPVRAEGTALAQGTALVHFADDDGPIICGKADRYAEGSDAQWINLSECHGITCPDCRRLMTQLQGTPPASEPPCANGHTWSNQFGDDWTPDVGTPCDCRQKQWGVPAASEPPPAAPEPAASLAEDDLLQHGRILELLSEHGIVETDSLKHRLEDHDRWRSELLSGELVERASLVAELVAKVEGLRCKRDCTDLYHEGRNAVVDAVLARLAEKEQQT